MGNLKEQQQIQDPSTQGTGGLKYNGNAMETPPSTPNVISARQLSSNMYSAMDADNESMRNVGMDYLNTDLGKSTYDSDIHSKSMLDDLQEARGELQPGWSQILNGTAKGVITAGTTFLNGTVGTVWGIASAIQNGVNGDNMVAGYWNNSFTQAMNDFTKEIEEAIPNYYTQYEVENPWSNLCTANFLGDKLIKNAGFTVGAAYTGLGMAGALGKASKLLNLSNKAANATRTIGSGVINGFAESSTEAINNYDKMRNEQQASEIQTYAGELEKLNQKYEGMLDAIPDRLIMSVDGTSGKMEKDPQSINALRLQYEAEKKKMDDIHNLMMAKIQDDCVKAGNLTFALNLPLTIGTDIKQMGALLGKGYDAGRKTYTTVERSFDKEAKALTDKTRKELSKSLGRKATDEELQTATKPLLDNLKRDIEKAPFSNSITTGTKVKAALKVTGSEGVQEWSQSAASAIAEDYYSQDILNYREAIVDNKAKQKTVDIMSSVSKSLINTLTDQDALMEGAIGAFMGAIGSPTFGKFGNSNAYLNKDGMIGMSGGIFGELMNLNTEQKEIQNLVNKANDIASKSPKLKAMLQGYVADEAFRQKLDEALVNGDKEDFKNQEMALLLNAVNTYAKIGRLDYLKSSMDNLDTDSEGAIEDILEQSKQEIKNSDGSKTVVSPFQDEHGNTIAKDDIKKSIKSNKDRITSAINSWNNSVDLLHSNYPSLSDEQVEELAFQAGINEDIHDRMLSMLNEYGPESNAIKTFADAEADYNTKRMAEDAQAKEEYEKDINKQKTSKAELDAELSALKAEKEATSKKIEEKKEQKKKYEEVISKQEELSKKEKEDLEAFNKATKELEASKKEGKNTKAQAEKVAEAKNKHTASKQSYDSFNRDSKDALYEAKKNVEAYDSELSTLTGEKNSIDNKIKPKEEERNKVAKYIEDNKAAPAPYSTLNRVSELRENLEALKKVIEAKKNILDYVHKSIQDKKKIRKVKQEEKEILSRIAGNLWSIQNYIAENPDTAGAAMAEVESLTKTLDKLTSISNALERKLRFYLANPNKLASDLATADKRAMEEAKKDYVKKIKDTYFKDVKTKEGLAEALQRLSEDTKAGKVEANTAHELYNDIKDNPNNPLHSLMAEVIALERAEDLTKGINGFCDDIIKVITDEINNGEREADRGKLLIAEVESWKQLMPEVNSASSITEYEEAFNKFLDNDISKKFPELGQAKETVDTKIKKYFDDKKTSITSETSDNTNKPISESQSSSPQPSTSIWDSIATENPPTAVGGNNDDATNNSSEKKQTAPTNTEVQSPDDIPSSDVGNTYRPSAASSSQGSIDNSETDTDSNMENMVDNTIPPYTIEDAPELSNIEDEGFVPVEDAKEPSQDGTDNTDDTDATDNSDGADISTEETKNPDSSTVDSDNKTKSKKEDNAEDTDSKDDIKEEEQNTEKKKEGDKKEEPAKKIENEDAENIVVENATAEDIASPSGVTNTGSPLAIETPPTTSSSNYLVTLDSEFTKKKDANGKYAPNSEAEDTIQERNTVLQWFGVFDNLNTGKIYNYLYGISNGNVGEVKVYFITSDNISTPFYTRKGNVKDDMSPMTAVEITKEDILKYNFKTSNTIYIGGKRYLIIGTVGFNKDDKSSKASYDYIREAAVMSRKEVDEQYAAYRLVPQWTLSNFKMSGVTSEPAYTTVKEVFKGRLQLAESSYIRDDTPIATASDMITGKVDTQGGGLLMVRHNGFSTWRTPKGIQVPKNASPGSMWTFIKGADNGWYPVALNVKSLHEVSKTSSIYKYVRDAVEVLVESKNDANGKQVPLWGKDNRIDAKGDLERLLYFGDRKLIFASTTSSIEIVGPNNEVIAAFTPDTTTGMSFTEQAMKFLVKFSETDTLRFNSKVTNDRISQPNLDALISAEAFYTDVVRDTLVNGSFIYESVSAGKPFIHNTKATANSYAPKPTLEAVVVTKDYGALGKYNEKTGQYYQSSGEVMTNANQRAALDLARNVSSGNSSSYKTINVGVTTYFYTRSLKDDIIGICQDKEGSYIPLTDAQFTKLQDAINKEIEKESLRQFEDVFSGSTSKEGEHSNVAAVSKTDDAMDSPNLNIVSAEDIETSKKDENGSVLENASTENKAAPNINKDSRGRTSKKNKKDSNKKEDSPSITGKMAEASKDLENNCK